MQPQIAKGDNTSIIDLLSHHFIAVYSNNCSISFLHRAIVYEPVFDSLSNHGSDMRVYANSWLLHDGARNHAAKQLVFVSV